MKALLLILLLSSAGWVFAEADPRLRELQAEYEHVQQEQQSMYQQFQMVQELRRNELQDRQPSAIQGYSAAGNDAAKALDFDENVRRQRERQERLQGYDRDIERAYGRYMELSNRKKVLLEQIAELAKQVPAAEPETVAVRNPPRAGQPALRKTK